MAAVCTDPASEVINALIVALRDAFDPAGPCPIDSTATPTVRFFAGDTEPPAAWNAHAQTAGCDEPLLWVRVVKRYRSDRFPDQTTVVDDCKTMRVVVVEVGIARCAVVDADPSWDDYATEAEVSLDDSRRIEKALCAAVTALRQDHRAGYESILPFGPEGGILGWTAQVLASF
jgi:hypothetical protein